MLGRASRLRYTRYHLDQSTGLDPVLPVRYDLLPRCETVIDHGEVLVRPGNLDGGLDDAAPGPDDERVGPVGTAHDRCRGHGYCAASGADQDTDIDELSRPQ